MLHSSPCCILSIVFSQLYSCVYWILIYSLILFVLRILQHVLFTLHQVWLNKYKTLFNTNFTKRKAVEVKEILMKSIHAILSGFQTSFSKACKKSNVMKHPLRSRTTLLSLGSDRRQLESWIWDGSLLQSHLRASSTLPCFYAFIGLLSVVSWWMPDGPLYSIKSSMMFITYTQPNAVAPKHIYTKKPWLKEPT